MSALSSWVLAAMLEYAPDRDHQPLADAIATVAPAQSPPGKASDEKYAERTLLPRTQEKVLRAIAERSPELVRDLYREDLIGAKEAAALGPKNPTPEEAARVTEIAREAKAVAESKPTKTPAEKRKVKREVNAKVRELTGRTVDPVHDVAKALSKVTPDRMADLVAALDASTAKLLMACLRDRIKGTS